MGLAALPGRRWFAFLARRQVVLSSPHPPAECGRRLEAVTGRLLFGRNGGLPLKGRVSPALIRVAIRQPAGSRNSVVAWFLLIPIAFVAIYVGLLVILPAKAQREIQQLLDELNVILDSTAALAVPSNGEACGATRLTRSRCGLESGVTWGIAWGLGCRCVLWGWSIGASPVWAG